MDSLRDLANAANGERESKQTEAMPNFPLPSSLVYAPSPQLFYQAAPGGISFLMHSQMNPDPRMAHSLVAPYPFAMSPAPSPMMVSLDALSHDPTIRTNTLQGSEFARNEEDRRTERSTKKRRLSDSSSSNGNPEEVTTKAKDRRKSNSTHEKNRRDKLNEGFEKVRALIPMCKPNKAGVLDSAVDLIQGLQSQNERLNQENMNLARELDMLRRQVQMQNMMTGMSQHHQDLMQRIQNGGPLMQQ